MPPPAGPPPSPGPACWLAAAAGLGGILLSPALVGRVVSLEWHLGDLRPFLHVAQGGAAAAALGLLLARRRVAAAWYRLFPDRRVLAFKLGALTVSTLLGLLLLEGLFRLARFPFNEAWTPSEYALARFDPELGWTYVPNRTHLETFGRPPRRVAIHINDQGLRVPQPGMHLDPDRPSVLFVGGSFTFGHGLPYEETFIGRLAADPAFPYQCVNLGVQAYGTDQAYLRLRRFLPPFRARAVVYTFIGRHIDRNANADRRYLFRRGRFVGTKPRFALREDGTLELRCRPRRLAEIPYSRVWATLKLAWVQRGPLPDLALTRALIRAMARYARRHGAAFVVVYWDQWPDPYAPRARRVLRDLDLPVLDTGLSPPPGWREWRIRGDGHPDGRAHAWVARELFRLLRRLRIVPE